MAECSVYRDGAELRTRQRLLPVAERQRRFDRTAGRNLDAEGCSLDSEVATAGPNRLFELAEVILRSGIASADPVVRFCEPARLASSTDHNTFDPQRLCGFPCFELIVS